MNDAVSSRTAAYMAFFRALETTEPRRRRLFSDAYAFDLLSKPLRAIARGANIALVRRLVYLLLDLGWPYTRSSGVVRTRAIDDLVNDGLGYGARQLVLLGAGFDSRGYRLPNLDRVKVFEVDHPATQTVKRERLRCTRLPIADLQFVPVNFERDDLEEKIAERGFDPHAPAVVVWEGVISYLTEPAVRSNFAVLSRLLAPSSRLIFTYMDKGAVEGSKSFPGSRRWKSWVSFSGEPFIFGFDPGTLRQDLEPFGFSLESDVSTQDIARQYCPALGRTEPGSEAYRVATAIRAVGLKHAQDQ
jgi:methyltransferase (TIGR00027 family)